jgi:hypothetical protein
MWSVFKGKIAGRAIPKNQWFLSQIESVSEWAVDRIEKEGYLWTGQEPEIDDDYVFSRKERGLSAPDDTDAWLAYLAKGGTLMKVPDRPRSRHYRLLVVEAGGTGTTHRVFDPSWRPSRTNFP